MHIKKKARMKRAFSLRKKIRELRAFRLNVSKSSRHIYAQIIAPDTEHVVAMASTLDSMLRKGMTGNIEAAKKVGTLIADRAKTAGIEKVVLDRSGFKYHGRIKALAEAAREAGLQI